jgi:hypothetical protein
LSAEFGDAVGLPDDLGEWPRAEHCSVEVRVAAKGSLVDLRAFGGSDGRHVIIGDLWRQLKILSRPLVTA